MGKKFKENFNFLTNISILALLILGSTIYAVGFHTANEILPGIFTGDYEFNGSIKLGGTTKICNLANKGTIKFNSSNNRFEGCNGVEWSNLNEPRGSSFNPGFSCNELLNNGISNDGPYWINPGGVSPFQIYCDMTTDGGGWTLIWKSNVNPSINTGEVNKAALNNINIDIFAKLSDSTINLIKNSSNTNSEGYRVEQLGSICVPDKKGFISAGCTFNFKAGGVSRGTDCDKAKVNYLDPWFLDSYINWCQATTWTSAIFCANDGTGNAITLQYSSTYTDTCQHVYKQTRAWVR